MKRKLIARPRAELDVINHAIFLTERNPRVAAQFLQSVKSAFREIAAEPMSSTTFRHRAMPDVELRFKHPKGFKRPKGFKSYLIYFQVTNDRVFVLRVLHASQDIDAALRPS